MVAFCLGMDKQYSLSGYASKAYITFFSSPGLDKSGICR